MAQSRGKPHCRAWTEESLPSFPGEAPGPSARRGSREGRGGGLSGQLVGAGAAGGFGPALAEMSVETLEEEGSSLAAVYTLLGLNPNHTGFLYMVSWQLRDQIW